MSHATTSFPSVSTTFPSVQPKPLLDTQLNCSHLHCPQPYHYEVPTGKVLRVIRTPISIQVTECPGIANFTTKERIFMSQADYPQKRSPHIYQYYKRKYHFLKTCHSMDPRLSRSRSQYSLEDGDSMFLGKVGIYLGVCTTPVLTRTCHRHKTKSHKFHSRSADQEISSLCGKNVHY